MDAKADCFTVRPQLGGLEWMEGTVPVQGGTVRVFCDGKTLRVETDAAGGTLFWQGKMLKIPVSEPLILDFV